MNKITSPYYRARRLRGYATAALLILAGLVMTAVLVQP